MGCLFALFAASFPRLALFMVWLLRPARVDAAFSTWIWPAIGFVLLPFTTLMYVVLDRPGVALDGWEWFWLAVAALFDLAHVGFAATQRRDVPGLRPPPPPPSTLAP